MFTICTSRSFAIIVAAGALMLSATAPALGAEPPRHNSGHGASSHSTRGLSASVRAKPLTAASVHRSGDADDRGHHSRPTRAAKKHATRDQDDQRHHVATQPIGTLRRMGSGHPRSGASRVVSTVPPVPTAVAAVVNGSGAAVISWKVNGASRAKGDVFEVRRRLQGETDFTLLGQTPGTTITDSSLPAGVVAEYRVVARRSGIYSATSATATVARRP